MTAQLSQAFGGLGLFLLGMWLMTEGLRLAAGPALERLLANWTRSRFRGLFSGVLITALVQSSSAVTVATLGFVNAGILTFRRAVWVIFGSNVGTTLTAWLVAVVGFRLDVDVLALPLIGVGALLRVFATRVRLQHVGMAMAGFGVLFLGIQMLADGFREVGASISFANGGHAVLMVLLGVALTTLMQSSSAAIALVLTALAGGVVGLADAAAAVIGANIGTTSTALIATLGATAAARRLAMAHVIFNLVTGAVALLALPFFLLLVVRVAGNPAEPAMTLAAFHSAFNLLGVILMWPLEGRMSQWLQTRFVGREVRATELRFLDRNVAAVPHLAQKALLMELDAALRGYPVLVKRAATAGAEQQTRTLERRQRLEKLAEFLMVLSRGELGDEQSRQLARAWRVQHNLINVEESLDQILAVLHQLDNEQGRPLRDRLQTWLTGLGGGLQRVEDEAPREVHFSRFAELYDSTKMEMLSVGLASGLPRPLMDQALQGCSASRRLAEQWLRAWNGLVWLNGDQDSPPEVSSAPG